MAHSQGIVELVINYCYFCTVFFLFTENIDLEISIYLLHL